MNFELYEINKIRIVIIINFLITTYLSLLLLLSLIFSNIYFIFIESRIIFVLNIKIQYNIKYSL